MGGLSGLLEARPSANCVSRARHSVISTRCLAHTDTEHCFMTYFVVEAEELINAGSEICRRYRAPVSLKITFRTRQTYS